MNLLKYIRSVKDFPKKGIDFKDISPILSDPGVFAQVISEMSRGVKSNGVDAIVAIESRGFVFGSVIANKLGLPFSMIRKFGKLPYKCYTVSYKLEYGVGKMQIHRDSLKRGWRVAIIDDVLATGGTIVAASKLIEKTGAMPVYSCVLLELAGLKGMEFIRRYEPKLKVVSIASV